MDRSEAEIFVRAFWMLDPQDRVEIVRSHDLVATNHVPRSADERRQWFRAALNRAQSLGRFDDVRDDVFDRVRDAKNGAADEPDPADVGIFVARYVED